MAVQSILPVSSAGQGSAHSCLMAFASTFPSSEVPPPTANIHMTDTLP